MPSDLDDEIRKLEEKIRGVEKKTNQSSIIAIGFGALGILVSIPWISGVNGYEAGFGAAASIGVLLWGVSLKDREDQAQRDLRNLERQLENLRSRLKKRV